MRTFNPKKEQERIIHFIQETLRKQKVKKIVIGLSGGIDSTTSLYLLKKAIDVENILAVYLPYFDESTNDVEEIIKDAKIPTDNFSVISVKHIVDSIGKDLSVENQIRKGNIMARVRMIILYDLAKKHSAMVAGTENKSEYFLGYFTRFGDQASDIEPLQHLYKTEVYTLARYLKVPEQIIQKAPSANLWLGQTDEEQFGFGYKEADEVLYRYFEQKDPVEQIKKAGFKNAEKIIDWVKSQEFKHRVPYSLLKS